MAYDIIDEKDPGNLYRDLSAKKRFWKDSGPSTFNQPPAYSALEFSPSADEANTAMLRQPRQIAPERRHLFQEATAPLPLNSRSIRSRGKYRSGFPMRSEFSGFWDLNPYDILPGSGAAKESVDDWWGKIFDLMDDPDALKLYVSGDINFNTAVAIATVCKAATEQEMYLNELGVIVADLLSRGEAPRPLILMYNKAASDLYTQNQKWWRALKVDWPQAPEPPVPPVYGTGRVLTETAIPGYGMPIRVLILTVEVPDDWFPDVILLKDPDPPWMVAAQNIIDRYNKIFDNFGGNQTEGLGVVFLGIPVVYWGVACFAGLIAAGTVAISWALGHTNRSKLDYNDQEIENQKNAGQLYLDCFNQPWDGSSKSHSEQCLKVSKIHNSGNWAKPQGFIDAFVPIVKWVAIGAIGVAAIKILAAKLNK